MEKNFISLAGGLLIGLTVGFISANYLSRQQVGGVSAGLPTPGQNQSASTEFTLTSEEISAKVKQADAAPGDLAFQRNLGLALYAYGASREDAALIGEAVRLLSRVETADRSDREVLIALGNCYFDIAYFRRDHSSFETSRKYYENALRLGPNDPNILVDLGLTFALIDPPDLRKATEFYDRALSADPRHERTLQMMTDAQIRLGQTPKAIETLLRLREVNPANPMIREFSAKTGAR